MLTRQLIPFNYVVPGESVNLLVDLQAMLATRPALHAAAARMQGRPKPRGTRQRLTINEFSGAEYRIINFIADLPLRLSNLQAPAAAPLSSDDSHVVFVLTEFQIADKATSVRNESGQSSHEAYKARQHEQVRVRLLRDEHAPPPDE